MQGSNWKFTKNKTIGNSLLVTLVIVRGGVVSRRRKAKDLAERMVCSSGAEGGSVGDAFPPPCAAGRSGRGGRGRVNVLL